MRITKKLPQFSGRTALLVAAGEQGAKFYIAGNGSVTRLYTFQVEKPRYSDNEGFFAAKRGGLARTGAVREENKEKTQTSFLHNFAHHLELVKHEYAISDVFVFIPSTIKNRIYKPLRDAFRREVQRVFEGNYFKFHPFILLKRIEESWPFPAQETEGEARKQEK